MGGVLNDRLFSAVGSAALCVICGVSIMMTFTANVIPLGAQGVPLKVIAEIVGHSDVRLTQNVYQEAKREAATKMDDLLTRAATAEIPVATKTTSDSIN